MKGKGLDVKGACNPWRPSKVTSKLFLHANLKMISL